MARIATVIDSTRVSLDGVEYTLVKVDETDTVQAPHFADAGDDSLPLPGDMAALDESEADELRATGYNDPTNAGVALPGEKRMYARDADGVIVGVIYLRASGLIDVGLNPTEFAAVASLVDAEIARVYDTVANWIPAPVPNDGGAAVAAQLKAAFALAALLVQPVGSAVVKVAT